MFCHRLYRWESSDEVSATGLFSTLSGVGEIAQLSQLAITGLSRHHDLLHDVLPLPRPIWMDLSSWGTNSATARMRMRTPMKRGARKRSPISVARSMPATDDHGCAVTAFRKAGGRPDEANPIWRAALISAVTKALLIARLTRRRKPADGAPVLSVAAPPLGPPQPADGWSKDSDSGLLLRELEVTASLVLRSAC
jgi:hypothetical protein